MRWIVRILAGAVALAVAAALIGGISVGPGTTSERVLTLLAVAVIFGLVNAIVRPIVRLISIPLFILTLGLFTFVVNAEPANGSVRPERRDPRSPGGVQVGVGREPLVQLEHHHAVGERPDRPGAGLAAGHP